MTTKHEDIMKQITRAISDCVTSSTQLNSLLNRLQGDGYNIFILLESSVGLKKHNVNMPLYKEKTLIKRTGNTGVQFKINVEDMEFLRKIGVDPIKKVPNKETR